MRLYCRAVADDAGLDVLIVAQPVTYGVAVCVRQLTEAAVAAGHAVTGRVPRAMTRGRWRAGSRAPEPTTWRWTWLASRRRGTSRT